MAAYIGSYTGMGDLRFSPEFRFFLLVEDIVFSSAIVA